MHLERCHSGEGLSRGDRRPQAIHSALHHALTEQERSQILEVANEPHFADIPPACIVPMLADEGSYFASESTFFCELLEVATLTCWSRNFGY